MKDDYYCCVLFVALRNEAILQRPSLVCKCESVCVHLRDGVGVEWWGGCGCAKTKALQGFQEFSDL